MADKYILVDVPKEADKKLDAPAFFSVLIEAEFGTFLHGGLHISLIDAINTARKRMQEKLRRYPHKPYKYRLVMWECYQPRHVPYVGFFYDPVNFQKYSAFMEGDIGKQLLFFFDVKNQLLKSIKKMKNSKKKKQLAHLFTPSERALLLDTV